MRILLNQRAKVSRIRDLVVAASVVILIAVAGLAAPAVVAGSGVAGAKPVGPTGAITDRNSDIEVARYAYRDRTMHSLAHQKAARYAKGKMTAKQATRSLNKHLGRYCASSKLIGFALSDQGYNSATIQNFYHQSGCLGAPRVTHKGPKR